MMSSRRAEIGRSASCLKTSGAAQPRAAARRAAAHSPRLTSCQSLSCASRFRSAKISPRCAAKRFHAAKAPLEFGVRRAQRRLGIDIELARQIGGREQ